MLRVEVAIGQLHIIHPFAILLNSEIKILAIDQKLRKIEELRN